MHGDEIQVYKHQEQTKSSWVGASHQGVDHIITNKPQEQEPASRATSDTYTGRAKRRIEIVVLLGCEKREEERR